MSDYEDEILAENFHENASWSMIASNDEGVDCMLCEEFESVCDDAIEM